MVFHRNEFSFISLHSQNNFQQVAKWFNGNIVDTDIITSSYNTVPGEFYSFMLDRWHIDFLRWRFKWIALYNDGKILDATKEFSQLLKVRNQLFFICLSVFPLFFPHRGSIALVHWFNSLRSKVAALLHEYYHNIKMILNSGSQRTYSVWH